MSFVFVRKMSALVVVAVAVPISYSQETMNNASVSGRVEDPAGAAVQDAQVTARQLETGVSSQTTTDREGRFRFPYLRIGQYEITVGHPGFGDVSQLLNATVGSAFDLPISLQLAAKSTDVFVHGQTALLDTARSEIAGTVSQTEVNQLPLNGRNFLDLALLIPGVSPTNTASINLCRNLSSSRTRNLYCSQRNFSNSFIVDGLSDNDDAAGVTGSFYGSTW